ncbi:MAG: hypothetical protein HQ593_05735 [Candidatus Omnitrophica bacterium]|nr:hypothetical protein [Candidatus Omnitrophota bacterium]
MNRFSIICISVFIGIAFIAGPLEVAADEALFESILVAGRDISEISAFVVDEEDLDGGEIVVKAQTSDNIEKIEVSVDAGKSWDGVPGMREYSYSFTPQMGKEYPVLVRGVTTSGKYTSNHIAVVQYKPRALYESIGRFLDEMRYAYMDERHDTFMAFFEPDEYESFTTLKENIQQTFDDSSNFNIKILVRNISYQDDLYIVRVDWDLRYNNTSTAKGRNDIIRLIKKDGEWKVVDLDNEGMFVVGIGTFKGNITDR